MVAAAACQAPAPPEPTPDPDSLSVTVRTYYATSAVRTLVLEDVIASSPAALDVTADCLLSTPPGITFVGYEGRISVETMGSDRYLYWSNRGTPDTSAVSIECSIIAESDAGETVQITVR